MDVRAIISPHAMPATPPKNTPPSVLVTGGGVRLGAALCTTFAEAGWHVLCQYRQSARAAQALCDTLVKRGLHATALQRHIRREVTVPWQFGSHRLQPGAYGEAWQQAWK